MNLDLVQAVLAMPFADWLEAEGMRGVRVLPAIQNESIGGSQLTWSAVSRSTGTSVGPYSAWSDIVGTHASVVYLDQTTRIRSPVDSTIDHGLFQLLVNCCSINDSFVGVAEWLGSEAGRHGTGFNMAWGGDALGLIEKLEVDDERYSVGTVSLSELLQARWGALGHVSPQVIWSVRGEWIVVAELDGSKTFFSASENLVEGLLTSDQVEAIEVPILGAR